jgi:putative aldouronate transport system substrate-binding protein
MAAVALAAAGLIHAGGAQPKPQGGGGGGVYQRDPNLNAPGTFPINKKKVALRIGIEQNAMVEDHETNWMTRQLEEKGNYDLSFEVYPAGEMRQKLELMVMAGGADLPDILIGGFDLAAITKYGQAGMIIPTNVYYKNSAHYINESKKDLSISDPEKYVTSYDGNIYGLWGLNSSRNNDFSADRILIYEPWLRKLGLKMPETIDEFLNVLRAFRDRDPNGNGRKDEIPLLTWKDNFAYTRYNYQYALMTPFIYTQPNMWMLNNGKIDVAFNKPGWRDGLRFTKQLVDEGLLSPLSFTQDLAQMTALVSADPPKAGAVVRFSGSFLGSNDKKRSEYWMVPPLEGPAGKSALWRLQTPSIRMIITKNCKTPESAFMLGDLMGGEEMSIIARYGEKGVDWIEPGPGEKSLVEGVPLAVKPISPWGVLQNKHWAETSPGIKGNKYAYADVSIGAENPLYDFVPAMARILPLQVKYATRPSITVIYNEEEQEVMNRFHATILTYVDESFARFVMGDLSIDRDWDGYAAEFSRMGLAEVIRATQSAYDRMNK